MIETSKTQPSKELENHSFGSNFLYEILTPKKMNIFITKTVEN